MHRERERAWGEMKNPANRRQIGPHRQDSDSSQAVPHQPQPGNFLSQTSLVREEAPRDAPIRMDIRENTRVTSADPRRSRDPHNHKQIT